MMFLGLKWYPPSFHVDDSSIKPLTVPDKIISLVKSSIQDSQPYLNSKDEISSECSSHCIVKFYTNTGPLALHEVSLNLHKHMTYIHIENMNKTSGTLWLQMIPLEVPYASSSLAYMTCTFCSI